MLLQTNRIFVALLTICLLGFVVDRIFRFIVERVLARYMSFVAVRRRLGAAAGRGTPMTHRMMIVATAVAAACALATSAPRRSRR